MTILAIQFALHGAIILMAGLIGGLFFARAIVRRKGEVAWRVVHAGGCSAGAMLLAIAAPSGWVAAAPALLAAMGIALIGGAYLLCAGMYLAAIWDVRGIPAGGTFRNRLIASFYGAGTVMLLAGCAVLITALLRTALIQWTT